LIGVDPNAALSTTLWTVFTACVGTIALVAVLEGWLLRKCNMAERLLLIAAAPAMLYPGTFTDFIGLICIVAVGALQFIRGKRS
ncbi:MAG: hypothetical protein J6P76_06345, partial [Acidaminococcaceae bacterium]|nr:hypothetical protein [Acidaminococcaceae bacterium]